MTREERIRAAIAGRETDRVPVAAWMHLSEHDQDPISLAEAEVELTEKYDFDYIKMMPFGLYSTQDFGNQVKIYCDPYKEPIVQKFAIDSPGSPCIGRYYSDDAGFCRVQYRCRCGRILFCYAKCRKDNDDGRRI